MLIGFKEEFKEKILAGTKIHTIRPIPKRMPKIGETLIMATGVRTKHYQKFSEEYLVKSIQRITISNKGVFVDDKPIRTNRVDELALNDGFESWYAFHKFFIKQYKTDKYPFYGYLYHWTDKRY